jgi:hypothetical protein
MEMYQQVERMPAGGKLRRDEHPTFVEFQDWWLCVAASRLNDCCEQGKSETEDRRLKTEDFHDGRAG